MYLDEINTGYVMLSSGIPWNISRVTCIFLVYERALYNHFIPCHIKYSGQQNHCDTRMAHDGKVGCINTVDYTTAILYSDWLYFLCLHSMV